MKKYILVFLLLLLVLSVSYYPTFSNNFVYDDNELILKNQYVQNKEWSEIWSNDYWESTRGESPYYRPLVISSFAFEHMFYGDNPFGYHIDNLILHFMVVILLFFLARKIISSFLKDKKKIFITSVLAAFIYALHPANSQSVYWIAARGDIFITIGILSGMLFTTSSKKISVLGLILSSFLSFFSKETGILFLILIPLYYIFFSVERKNKSWKQLIPNLIPIIFVFIIYIFLRFQFVKLSPFLSVDESFWQNSDGLLVRILSIPSIWSFYILRTFFPYYLNFESGIHLFYSFSDWQFILGSIVLLSSIVFVIAYKNNKLFLWTFSFWTICLLPVLNIFPAFESGMEHYLYLPLTSISILLAYILTRTKYLYICTIFILMTFIPVIFSRGYIWRDDYSLWSDAVSKTGIHCRQGWTRARFNLASFYFDSAKESENTEVNLQNAIGLYNEIERFYPDYGGVYIALGDIKTFKGFYTEAEYYYRKAIERYPNNHILYNKYGIALASSEKFDQAEMQFEKAIKIKSDYTDAFVNLAHMYLIRGDIDSAERILISIKNIQENIELNLNSLIISVDILKGRDIRGDYDEKIQAVDILSQGKFYDAKLELLSQMFNEDPGDSNIFYTICLTNLTELKDLRTAFYMLQVGTKDFPGDTRFLRELAVFYILHNDSARASNLFKKIIEIQPDHPEVDQMNNYIINFESSY